jgi:hypothetical protein
MIFRNHALVSALAFLCTILSATTLAWAEDESESERVVVPLTQQQVEQAQKVQATVTTTVPLSTTKIVPAEYNGDVRDLPQVTGPQRMHTWNEFEEPVSHKQAPSLPSSPTPPNVSLAPMPATSQNFAGINFNDGVTGGQAGAGWPPDINGDVGPNNFIEGVNDAWVIYSKTGLQQAAFTENSLWNSASTGTPCDIHNQGDPVVLHDGLTDRWILTNFGFAVSGSTPVAPFYQCFAVSKTSNPVTGGWWLYAVQMDPGGVGKPASGMFNDYGKLGLWTDCLYLATNEFNQNAGGAFSGVAFASFSRTDMYAGNALTGSNSSLGFLAATNNPFTMIPSNLLGTSAGSLPPAGTPNYFVSESNIAFGYEVRKFTAGANCGAGGTLGSAVTVGQATYSGGGGTVIDQPGTTNKLDSLFDRLMQKVQYRKIGATESLWVVHSVQDTGATVRPQWAQINVTGGTVVTTPVQQQIYAPDTTLHRWMGSLAVDAQGNMALGYSTSGTAAGAFPSIAYSGRLAGDPLNSLPQTETVLQAGAGSQTNNCGGAPCHRWGDYTAMSLDPSDDCTFWYIDEYYNSQANGTAGNWQTRIGSFKFPTCGGVVTFTVTPSVTGNGSISPNTPQTVNSGATTAFTLTPNANNHIVNVTGTCGGTLVANTFTTSAISANCTVIANFAIDTFTVTPSVTGSGSISPNTQQTVNSGATTAFTLTPNASNHIVNVTGTCGGTLVGNTYTTAAVAANCTVIANFAIDTFTVTPSVTGNGSISPNTPQTVNSGSTTAFTLTPNANNHIVNVTGTCSGSLVSNTFTTAAVTANCTVIANFAIDTFTVTPSVTGNGSISPNTPQTVNSGATTAFTLTPNANNHIVNVTGTCGGSLVGNTFTTAAVTTNCTVIANFAINTFTVTPSVTGNGSISPNTPQTVNSGSTTAFTLTPNANNHIVNVTGTCGGSLVSNTYTTNAISANCTVIANFAIDTFTVTPSVTGNGSISPNTPQTVNSGSTTAFTLTPNANNHIVNVTGTCGGSLVGNTFTTAAVTANCTVIANFAIDTFTVTPSVTGNGSISPNTPQTVNSGATTAFTLTPNANNHIVNVTGTCGGSLVGNTFTTAAVTANCTVIANFAIDTFTVTPSVTGNGSISPNTPQTVNSGATIAFTLTPNANNHIVNVTGTCGGSLVSNTYTTNAISANCTVIANFAIDTFTVTPSVTGNGSISPNTPQTVSSGATTAFTLTPNANNHIVNVTGTCGGTLVANTFTTSAISANCTVTANFALNVLVFTTQPANVSRGQALGTIVVTEQDGNGNTISDNATVDFFVINVCGASLDLGSVSMVNGVATMNSSQRFYTLVSGRTIGATGGGLNATSAGFNVVSGSDYVFADGYEACRP